MQIVFLAIFVITTIRKILIALLFNRPDANKEEPIYIVELGAGHGKLGFLILNHLAQLSEFMPEGIALFMLKTYRCY